MLHFAVTTELRGEMLSWKGRRSRVSLAASHKSGSDAYGVGIEKMAEHSRCLCQDEPIIGNGEGNGFAQLAAALILS
jgi:hypothetical protein